MARGRNPRYPTPVPARLPAARGTRSCSHADTREKAPTRARGAFRSSLMSLPPCQRGGFLLIGVFRAINGIIRCAPEADRIIRSALASKRIVPLRAGRHTQLFRSGVGKRHHEQILCDRSVEASIAQCTELGGGMSPESSARCSAICSSSSYPVQTICLWISSCALRNRSAAVKPSSSV